MQMIVCETCTASGRLANGGMVWEADATSKCKDIEASKKATWSGVLSACPSMGRAIAKAVDDHWSKIKR